MPYMINLHGIVKMVNASDVETATQHGLRLVDDLDIATLQGLQNNDFFSVHNVQGFEKGALGTQPVYVRGKGPSASAAGPSSAFTIDVNRIIDSDTDIVVALDTIAWDTIPYMDGVVRYAPKGFEGSRTRDFTLPMRTGNITINEEQAITKAHFTGIAAILLALYITDGPVIISGFDLSGNDAAGKSYEARQLGAWNAAFRVWNPDSKEVSGRVFCHQEQARTFGAPVWYSQNTEEDLITVVGSGPSCEDLPEETGPIGTANAGILRIANPRYYWLTDSLARTLYTLKAKIRSALCGTKIVNGDTFPYRNKGENFHGRAAGVMILRYMLETHKPKKVILRGFDGYNSTEGPGPGWCEGMNRAMVGALKRIIDENPDVEFDWICSGPLKQMVVGE